MVVSGLMWNWRRFRLDRFVNVFCDDNFRLFCLFVKNIVGQKLAFVKQGNVLFGIHANSNRRVSHGIRGALSLNLINNFFKLNC